MQSQKDYQTDLFTPEQRVALFDALVRNAKNPLDVVSEVTMTNAVEWGRSELIPKLYAIGVPVKDLHFVKAGQPLHRKHLAVPTMEALLPFVRDVNVTTNSNENAGHVTSRAADLEAFKWLEGKGLDKTTLADFNVPSYAHLVAKPESFSRFETQNDRVKFAEHLVKNDYPLNAVKVFHDTPTETATGVAFSEGNHPVGLVFVKGGAEVRPDYLALAIHSRHFNTVSTPEVLDLIDSFKELGLLKDPAMLRNGIKEVFKLVEWNDKNVPLVAPIARALVREGAPLEPGEKERIDALFSAKPVAKKAIELNS